MTVRLDARCSLHPEVAIRPERFGALAYHYGNRRLLFLKHPDVVALVASMGGHDTLEDALRTSGIAEERWPAFVEALGALERSEVVRVG